MNAAILYVKANAVLLALVAIALFQQSEIIYSVVQTSEKNSGDPRRRLGR
ncbi:MAG: hypothetical protein CM15mP84_03100 [Cellvibrionales bacterium]|nr:MAG: hypothetical protein CM15mP84_03100 [Cellvibrionales bacterium]